MTIFENIPLVYDVRGVGGVPEYFFVWNPNIYVTFGTLRQTLLGF